MLKQWFFRVVLLTALAVLGTGIAALADEAPRISKEDVKARLGAKDTSIIDVRTISDWKESGLKVKGAVREDPTEVEKWASRYPKDRTLILYCA
jgi:rhodanese-related sulfurtransferase